MQINEDNPISSIPRIIHQTAKTKTVPLIWQGHHKAWKRLFPEPEWTHILHDDEDNRGLVMKYAPWFLETYDAFPRNIMRVDAARCLMLYDKGGIYADLDYRPYECFEQDLVGKDIWIVESTPYDGGYQNSLMASVPGHEFWFNALRHMQYLWDTKLNKSAVTTDDVMDITGPRSISYSINSAKTTTQIGILPYQSYLHGGKGKHFNSNSWVTVLPEFVNAFIIVCMGLCFVGAFVCVLWRFNFPTK
jgi:mannosyltransferase OCH1-like enzyme